MSDTAPPSPDPSLSPAAANAMEAFAAFMESQRQEMESKFGFWTAGPPRGHWRFLLSLDQGRGRDRQVAQASWDNAAAQALACQALGLPGPSLPAWASSQGVCSLWGLHFLFAASDALDASGWAESPGSDTEGSERLPSETNTACALWMGRGQAQASLAAGLVKAWAEATGGSFQANGVEAAAPEGGWGEALSRVIAPLDFSAMPQRDFSDPYAKDLATMSLPAPGAARPASALIDLRAAARVMGCPLELSLAAPEYKHLLCWDRIQSELSRRARDNPAQFAQEFGECFVEMSSPAAKAGALQALQTRQEARVIAAAAGPAARSKASPRV